MSGIICYIQYTLNDYDDEHLEKEVPKIVDRIRTFQKLVFGFADNLSHRKVKANLEASQIHSRVPLKALSSTSIPTIWARVPTGNITR